MSEMFFPAVLCLYFVVFAGLVLALSGMWIYSRETVNPNIVGLFLSTSGALIAMSGIVLCLTALALVSDSAV